MEKIKRMAKMYGCVDIDEEWEFRVVVYVDGITAEFYFADEEKAGWFFSKANKIAGEVQGFHKWGDYLLPW